MGCQSQICRDSNELNGSRIPCFSNMSRWARTSLTQAHLYQTAVFSLPSSPELLVVKDYVKDNAQTVPTLGLAPPSWYMHSYENRTRESSAQQMTMHKTLHQQPREEEFGSREWIATLNLDNAGRYRHISVQGHCSSLQAFTDVKMLQMTSPEREEIKKGFYVPESPPKPSTRLSRTGQVQQYPRCRIDVLPGPQLQQPAADSRAAISRVSAACNGGPVRL
ncbi:hypothetical protein MRX96_029910 [Rhipicephalus microplus]